MANVGLSPQLPPAKLTVLRYEDQQVYTLTSPRSVTIQCKDSRVLKMTYSKAITWHYIKVALDSTIDGADNVDFSTTFVVETVEMIYELLRLEALRNQSLSLLHPDVATDLEKYNDKYLAKLTAELPQFGNTPCYGELVGMMLFFGLALGHNIVFPSFERNYYTKIATHHWYTIIRSLDVITADVYDEEQQYYGEVDIDHDMVAKILNLFNHPTIEYAIAKYTLTIFGDVPIPKMLACPVHDSLP